MITEDYCSFEIAKLLRKKGFNESCHQKYDSEGYLSFNHVGYINDEKPCDDFYALAPTHQMAVKWLRDIHNLDIIVPPQFDNSKWTYSAIIFKLSIPCTEIRLNDNKDKKEEAYEEAIKYCLENLI